MAKKKMEIPEDKWKKYDEYVSMAEVRKHWYYVLGFLAILLNVIPAILDFKYSDNKGLVEVAGYITIIVDLIMAYVVFFQLNEAYLNALNAADELELLFMEYADLTGRFTGMSKNDAENQFNNDYVEIIRNFKAGRKAAAQASKTELDKLRTSK